MRSPPPVNIELRSGPLWRLAQGTLVSLALSVPAFWCSALLESPEWVGWLAGCSGPLLVWLARPLVPATAAPWLAFDGQRWSCHTPAQSDGWRNCRPRLTVDLGAWMLLRLDPEEEAPGWGGVAGLRLAARSRWAAVSRAHAGPQWQALRVALYCSQGNADPLRVSFTPTGGGQRTVRLRGRSEPGNPGRAERGRPDD